jgi:hypothetical protein
MSTTLEGWDEIASHMKKCMKTVQRYATRNRDPLPVYKQFYRVLAKSDELDAWTRRQIRHVSARRKPRLVDPAKRGKAA